MSMSRLTQPLRGLSSNYGKPSRLNAQPSIRFWIGTKNMGWRFGPPSDHRRSTRSEPPSRVLGRMVLRSAGWRVADGICWITSSLSTNAASGDCSANTFGIIMRIALTWGWKKARQMAGIGQPDAGVLRHCHGSAGCITATIALRSPHRCKRSSQERPLCSRLFSARSQGSSQDATVTCAVF